MDSEFVFHIELAEGRNVEAGLAAELFAAWVSLLYETSRAVDPYGGVVIELVGVQKGSLDFKQVLRTADWALGTVLEGADDYPYLKKAGLALGVAALSAGMGAGVGKLFESDVQKVEVVSESQHAINELAAKSEAVQEASKVFYSVAQKVPKVTKVGVAERTGKAPVYEVPADQFAERSGLWTDGESTVAEYATHTVQAEWVVVLIKAAAVAEPRAWRFSRDGVEFSAVMDDREYLDAIREGRVPITLKEGVSMRVFVRYRERFDGQSWTYIPQSRRIVRVASPAPLPGRSPTLPFPDGPKK